MDGTPHNRLALVPISLELLTELLRGQCTGPLETNAPRDLVVYGLMCHPDRAAVGLAIVGSDTFEPVPEGQPLPLLEPWRYTRKEPGNTAATETRRCAALAARLFEDDPYAIHPDIAFSEMNESARTAAHSTAQMIAQKILEALSEEPTS